MRKVIVGNAEMRILIQSVCARTERLLAICMNRRTLGLSEDESITDVLEKCRDLSGEERVIQRVLADFAKKAESVFCQKAEDLLFLACALYQELAPLLVYENPIRIKRELHTLCEELLDGAEQKRKQPEWEEYCKKVTDDSDISKLLLEKIREVGVTGYSYVKKSASGEDDMVLRSGHRYDAVGKILQETTGWKYPYVVISTLPIQRVEEILPFMTACAKEKRPLILVAEYMEEAPLASFRYNILHGGLQGNFFQALKYGTEREIFLDDLALLCRGTVISRENGGFEAADLSMMGTLEEVCCENGSTWFYTNDDGHVQNRSALLKEHTRSMFEEERLAFLSGKVAKILVGGIGMEQEMRAKELTGLLQRMELDARGGVWEGKSPIQDFLEKFPEKGTYIIRDAVERALHCAEKQWECEMWSWCKVTDGFRMVCSVVGELVTLEGIVL